MVLGLETDELQSVESQPLFDRLAQTMVSDASLLTRHVLHLTVQALANDLQPVRSARPSVILSK